MNWLEQNNSLTKTIVYGTQTELAEFVLNIAIIADKLNHHPDYTIRKCSELEISLTTHDENRITKKDYQLAEIIDLKLKNLGMKKN